MKKILLASIWILLSINLIGNDDVYSETNAYNINQTNSNNTYNDNSKVLSDNTFNFSLFNKLGNNYSDYMNYESFVYIDAYATTTFNGTTQYAVGAQLGIYENLYAVSHYGVFSQSSESVLNVDGSYDKNTYKGEGNYIDYGFSYHIRTSTDFLLSIDFLHRKMLDGKYILVDYSEYNSSGDYKQPLDTNFFMLKATWFKQSAHTGFELGMGFGGVDTLIFSTGLKFRYF